MNTVAKVRNGTKGTAEWEGNTAPAAMNVIDGTTVLAIRTSHGPKRGTRVRFAQHEWLIRAERPATVRGMVAVVVEDAVMML